MKVFRMKSLDDVLKAWKICQSNPETCEGCPYEKEYRDTVGANSCYLDDAFAWLSGYQAHIQLDKMRDKYEAENEPLTWEELLYMKGKPVWVEFLKENKKYWTVILSVGKMKDGKYLFTDTDTFYCDDEMGKKWNAYRKERNENA